MNFLKTNLTEFTIVLALIIALFPDVFKESGKALIELIITNGLTNNLLIAISIILLYICRQCWTIKKLNKK